MKLPKQWKHWCQSAGLRPESGLRAPMWAWAHLIGHGRRWRVNCRGEFQMSERLYNFDRWANSVQASTSGPACKAEMIAAVRELKRPTAQTA